MFPGGKIDRFLVRSSETQTITLTPTPNATPRVPPIASDRQTDRQGYLSESENPNANTCFAPELKIMSLNSAYSQRKCNCKYDWISISI